MSLLPQRAKGSDVQGSHVASQVGTRRKAHLQGSSIIYAPMYLKNVFYDPLMQALGCTNADLGLMVSAYGIAAMICYLPSGIVADKFRMRTLATVGFLARRCSWASTPCRRRWRSALVLFEPWASPPSSCGGAPASR